MKTISRIIFYSVNFVLLTLAFSYMHLTNRFINETTVHGKPAPSGDQIYAWQNHGIVYLDYKDAFIAQNEFLGWIIVALFVGICSGIVGNVLGIKFRPRKEWRGLNRILGGE